MKNKNLAECILFSVFMIIGITFIIIGGIWYYIVREKENTWVSTQATIIDIEKSEIYNSKIVWVEFSIKNHIYQVELPEYYSSMKIGKNIMIYYNPSNPNEIISKNFLGHLIFIGMGVVFTIIGLAPTILKIFKNRKKKNLMRNGKKIEATIDNISFKMNYSVNGRHPYILECSYVDLETGAVYFFKSDSVWYSIETLLEHNNITTVPVYVDTKNLKKYYVDITMFEKYLGK